MPAIGDGGIKYSGDLAKAIAAGADVVMIGSLLAGAEESAGRSVPLSGPVVQILSRHGIRRRHGSAGSAARYFQGDVKDHLKLVPEGIEGQVPYRGPLAPILYQLGRRVARRHGLCRRADHRRIPSQGQFVRITNAGLRESHAHDVTITRESPNYPTGV